MGTLLIANRNLVKKADPDRYICTLFADRDVQEFLFAIYALYNELAAIPFRTQEADLGGIRLQWWREALLASKLEINLSKDPIMQGIYKLNGQFFPRDTKDQIKFIKNKISIDKVRMGDLFFWKGHVGLALNKKFLIHAYGPKKKVIVSKINVIINKLQKKRLSLLAIKRYKLK